MGKGGSGRRVGPVMRSWNFRLRNEKAVEGFKWRE